MIWAEQGLLLLALALMAAAAVPAFRGWRLTRALLLAAAILLAIAVILRTIYNGYPAFSSVSETLVFFALLLAVRVQTLQGISSRQRWLFHIPVMLLLTAAVCQPFAGRSHSALSPVLDSPWFFIHIPLFFLGYLCVLTALVWAVITVAGGTDRRRERDREALLAFWFLCGGMVTGSLWADQSWGVFWNNDPKEWSALVLCVLSGLYFHLRGDRRRLMILVLMAAGIVITWFGVTFLLPGLHSY